MEQIQSGIYDVVLVTPPCSTFTRARSANKRGPPPIRSKQHPKGYPRLPNLAIGLWRSWRSVTWLQQGPGNAFRSSSCSFPSTQKIWGECAERKMDCRSIRHPSGSLKVLAVCCNWTWNFLLWVSTRTVLGPPIRSPHVLFPTLLSCNLGAFPGLNLIGTICIWGPFCPVFVKSKPPWQRKAIQKRSGQRDPAQIDESLAQAVVLALKPMLSSPPEGGGQESIDGSKWDRKSKTSSRAEGAFERSVSPKLEISRAAKKAVVSSG